jgi:hypothetical protein
MSNQLNGDCLIELTIFPLFEYICHHFHSFILIQSMSYKHTRFKFNRKQNSMIGFWSNWIDQSWIFFSFCYIYIYTYIYDSLSFGGFETRPYVGRPTSNRNEREREKGKVRVWGSCMSGLFFEREKNNYMCLSRFELFVGNHVDLVSS